MLTNEYETLVNSAGILPGQGSGGLLKSPLAAPLAQLNTLKTQVLAQFPKSIEAVDKYIEALTTYQTDKFNGLITDLSLTNSILAREKEEVKVNRMFEALVHNTVENNASATDTVFSQPTNAFDPAAPFATLTTKGPSEAEQCISDVMALVSAIVPVDPNDPNPPTETPEEQADPQIAARIDQSIAQLATDVGQEKTYLNQSMQKINGASLLSMLSMAGTNQVREVVTGLIDIDRISGPMLKALQENQVSQIATSTTQAISKVLHDPTSAVPQIVNLNIVPPPLPLTEPIAEMEAVAAKIAATQTELNTTQRNASEWLRVYVNDWKTSVGYRQAQIDAGATDTYPDGDPNASPAALAKWKELSARNQTQSFYFDTYYGGTLKQLSERLEQFKTDYQRLRAYGLTGV